MIVNSLSSLSFSLPRIDDVLYFRICNENAISDQDSDLRSAQVCIFQVEIFYLEGLTANEIVKAQCRQLHTRTYMSSQNRQQQRKYEKCG